MMVVSDPWFWAFLALIGWFLGMFVIGSKRFGSRLSFGVVCLILAEAPRIILPLPFVAQPRFEAEAGLLALLGLFVLVGSLAFGTPAFFIRPLTRPNRKERLLTGGFYSVIRHPLMFCDAFWPLGWSLIFGSVIGVLLTPVWFLVAYLATFLEEEKLLEEYGETYAHYRREVPRIIPFIKFL